MFTAVFVSGVKMYPQHLEISLVQLNRNTWQRKSRPLNRVLLLEILPKFQLKTCHPKTQLTIKLKRLFTSTTVQILTNTSRHMNLGLTHYPPYDRERLAIGDRS